MKTEAVVHPANLGANDSPVDFVRQQGRAILNQCASQMILISNSQDMEHFSLGLQRSVSVHQQR